MIKAKKIGKVLFFVIVLTVVLILSGVLGVILRFSNCGTDSFKTFYVENENHKIYSTMDTAYIPLEETTRFNVKYLFEKSNKTTSDYSVEVRPLITTDTLFEYTVNNNKCIYNPNLDLSSAFKLDKQNGYFTISAPCDMVEVLRIVHDEYKIGVPETVDILTKCYFRIIVTSYDEKNTIILNLRFSAELIGAELDQSVIIFE